MKSKNQTSETKPLTKILETRVDPTTHHKLKIIAVQQAIPLKELSRRILSYYANAYMPITPKPCLPYEVKTETAIHKNLHNEPTRDSQIFRTSEW